MEEAMRTMLVGLAMVLIGAGAPRPAAAAEIKVLTAGAFKQVLLALLPDFERTSGHKVVIKNDTVGALTKRIERHLCCRSARQARNCRRGEAEGKVDPRRRGGVARGARRGRARHSPKQRNLAGERRHARRAA